MKARILCSTCGAEKSWFSNPCLPCKKREITAAQSANSSCHYGCFLAKMCIGEPRNMIIDELSRFLDRKHLEKMSDVGLDNLIAGYQDGTLAISHVRRTK